MPIFLFILVSCSSSPAPQKLAAKTQLTTRSQVHLGTYVSVSLPNDQVHLHSKAFETFRRVDEKLSTYREDSEISQLNRQRELRVSPLTQRALQAARDWSDLSEGNYNAGLGLWTKPFRDGKGERKKPSTPPPIFHESIDITGNRVRLLNILTQIDLGGIGKGFAVDQARRKIEETGGRDFVIRASGDIYCLSRCDFAIRNPFNTDQIIAHFLSRVSRLSISTSGNYENFLESPLENHLLNSKTGESQKTFASVTVIKRDDNTGADALATAASVMPLERARQLLRQNDCAFLFILSDGRQIRSKNFNDWIETSTSEK